MIFLESDSAPVPEFLSSDFLINSLGDLCSNENLKLGEITIVCCSDDGLLKINQQYLNHDYYTDIITFDYTESGLVSGDLFISVDRISDNSNSENVSFENEMNRVIIHGVLHLCGYGDKCEEEKVQMRSKEDYYLSQIGFT